MAAPLDNLFVREIERNDGKTLKINQSEIGDVGCVVWDAALVLTKYLETNDFQRGTAWKGKRVVELGAGTGVVGLYAASLGATVTITDLPELIPLIQRNIDDNVKVVTGSATTEPLTWGSDTCNQSCRNPDYIFLADCIYYEESLNPLMSTMCDLCGPRTVVLCCYEQRDTEIKKVLEAQFFNLVRESFVIEEVPLERQDPQFCSDDIHILKFIRKSESDVT
ncbi:protein-lysine methyltransferase METTL21D-like [Gigantopelta aegis]|uniref:protein-lysine methyltransferase METTL21D-like n=1 Tax=Gigantopelta aegis TaxID=1735272 RepID=UPI001B88A315|nr:protein-lysine methyltransferase METTL21D-like [Gigantopelta aegis]